MGRNHDRVSAGTVALSPRGPDRELMRAVQPSSALTDGAGIPPEMVPEDDAVDMVLVLLWAKARQEVPGKAPEGEQALIQFSRFRRD